MKSRNVVSEPFSCVHVTLVANDGDAVLAAPLPLPPPSTGDMDRPCAERGSKPGMPGDVGNALPCMLPPPLAVDGVDDACDRTGRIVYSTRNRIGLQEMDLPLCGSRIRSNKYCDGPCCVSGKLLCARELARMVAPIWTKSDSHVTLVLVRFSTDIRTCICRFGSRPWNQECFAPMDKGASPPMGEAGRGICAWDCCSIPTMSTPKPIGSPSPRSVPMRLRRGRILDWPVEPDAVRPDDNVGFGDASEDGRLARPKGLLGLGGPPKALLGRLAAAGVGLGLEGRTPGVGLVERPAGPAAGTVPADAFNGPERRVLAGGLDGTVADTGLAGRGDVDTGTGVRPPENGTEGRAAEGDAAGTNPAGDVLTGRAVGNGLAGRPGGAGPDGRIVVTGVEVTGRTEGAAPGACGATDGLAGWRAGMGLDKRVAGAADVGLVGMTTGPEPARDPGTKPPKGDAMGLVGLLMPFVPAGTGTVPSAVCARSRSGTILGT